MTALAFDNGELIKDLRLRGGAIKKEDWDKVDKINLDINTKMHQKIGKFTRPVSMFVTFENEEGY